MRLRFCYFSPDVFYETLVTKLITPSSAWLDVGCGRNIFPGNQPLAQILAERCRLLVGLDPDETIDDNPYIHQRIKQQIDEYHGEQMFDVVTLRMVAEHITNPQAAISSLARLTRPGGKLVVFTINKFSPVSIAAKLVPHRFHHSIKRLFWDTDKRDTFPVAYRMNTRKTLVRLFESNHFRLLHFSHIPDSHVFGALRPLHYLELSAWRFCRSLNLTYPENCLLAVFERLESSTLEVGSRESHLVNPPTSRS